ncbi:MAG: ABC transporter substrate-binding protein [Chloroflexota bacterium]|nr:ABC transporter substrate-binding protein [Chloroflexota bacterium]
MMAVLVVTALTSDAVSLSATGATGRMQSKAAAGGTVSIGEIEPDHLTPNRSTLAFDEAHALFTPLMNITPKGKIVKAMAKSIVPSKGARVWTITIKKGWTFQNGEPVRSSSFVNAWNATAYGPNAWLNNGQLSDIAGYPALNPAKKGAKPAKKLAGLKILNPTSFRVTLIKADSQFPWELTANQAGFYPLPKAAFTNPAGYDLAPVGNGPFEMVGKWQHNVAINVRRWSGYKGTKPHVAAIHFKIYSSLETAYNDVLAGNLSITDIGLNQYGQAIKQFPNALIAFNAPAIDFLGFSLWDPQLKDKRVREAISMAIDRPAISKALFAGLLTPASDWVPANVPGYHKGLCGQFCTYNLAKAKSLLKAAGGFKGTLTIAYPGGQGYDPTYQAIGNEIRQNLGIKVTYSVPNGFGPFLTDVGAKKINGAYRGHWGALYPSMVNTLQSLYTPTGAGYFELVVYNNPKVTAALLAGNAATTQAGAVAQYRHADDLIAADFPTAPLFYSRYVYIHSNHVSNVVIDDNQIELSKLTVP